MKYLFYLFFLFQIGRSSFAGEGADDSAAIAQLMREIQARYLLFVDPGSNDFYEWPGCLNGQPAPAYPADDFYSGETDNADRAIVLVQSIISGFDFVRPKFVKYDQVEGSISVPHYARSDFAFLNVSVTAGNYRSILGQIRNAIDELTAIERPITVSSGQSKVAVGYGSAWSTVPSYVQVSEQQAIGQWSNWTSSDYDQPIYASSYAQDSGSFASHGVSNRKGILKCDLTMLGENRPKIVKTYLKLNRFDPGTLSPSTMPNNIPIDGKYHFYTNIPPRTSSWVSPYIGEQREPFQIVSGNNSASWSYSGGVAIAQLEKFDTSPDDGINCCGTGCSDCLMGDLNVSLGSVHIQISVGSGGRYQGSAYLLLRSEVMNAALSKPSALMIVAPTTVTVKKRYFTEGGISKSEVRQILTKDGFLDVVTVNSFKYKLNFYTLDALAKTAQGYTLDPDGFYIIASGHSPVKVIEIENPEASSGDVSRLRISEKSSSVDKKFEYLLESVGGQEVWTLDTNNRAKIESISNVWNSTNTKRTETTATSQTIDGNEVLQNKLETTYQIFPWGESKVQEVGDPDGASVTSSWSYYEQPSENGYGRVKQWIDGSTGYWERYEYDSDGLLCKTVRQYLGAAVGSPDNQSDVETIEHPDSNTTLTVRSLSGVEVARSYRAFVNSLTRKDEVCTVPGAALGATTNLVTITKYTNSNHDKVASILRPDGTMIIYQYPTNQQVTFQGEPNAAKTAIVDGTKTTVLYNSSNRVTSTVTTDIVTDVIISSEEADTAQPDCFDSVGRVQRWKYHDGTVRVVHYDCCGVSDETDRDGITTVYTYDALGNLDTETRAGITLDYDYDALGRLVKTTRIGNVVPPEGTGGPAGTSRITQAATYDLAGRQTSTRDILDSASRAVTETVSQGIITRTEVLTGGATRIEKTYSDGRLKEVSGTGEHGLAYEYGTSSGGMIVTTETQASGPWKKRYVDMAGREVKIEYPGSVFEQFSYNAGGQLEHQIDPDGVTTTYGYNTKGEKETVARGGRVTKTVHNVATRPEGTVIRTTVSKIDGANEMVVSVDDEAVESRKKWHSEYGQETATVIVQTGQMMMRTSTRPDGSILAETFYNGRPDSSSHGSANGVQSLINYEHDHDGRLWRTIYGGSDKIVTLTYYNNDRIHTETVANSAQGLTQTTEHFYSFEGNGLVDSATLPGGRTSIRKYYPTGELKSISGTAEYGVDYQYDAQGRMTKMSGVTPDGPTRTTWLYSPTRGWLMSKDDGKHPAVQYTYYDSGRLHTRTWSRGVVTTYGYYPDTGDLHTTTYSDGTPSVGLTYDGYGRMQTISDYAGLHTLGYWPDTDLPSADVISGGELSGVSTLQTYDSKLRRQTFTASRSGTLASYTNTYDGLSRLATVTDATGLSANYTYTYISNLIDKIDLFKNGGAGVLLDKNYDGLERLTSSSTLSTGPAVSYNYLYDNAGQRERATSGDGSYWHYEYDAIGQVKVGGKKWSDGTDVLGQQYAYSYDPFGNRLTATVNGHTFSYAPDVDNTYVSRSVPGYIAVVGEVDPAANVVVNGAAASRQNAGAYFSRDIPVTNTSAPVYLQTTVAATKASASATVDGHIFVPKATEEFAYDADGNLTSDGRWIYQWDGENRLKSMETQSAAVSAGAPKQRLTFAYDAQGRRISKKVEEWIGNGYAEHHTILFLYDGWNLVAEILKGTGQTLRSYVWGSDMSGGQAAGGIGGLLFIKQFPEGKAYGVGYDGNGNVAVLNDMADGNQAARYEYGPFGELLRASGPMAKVNPFRFSTNYTDEESGLIFGKKRWYQPILGRWLSRDPIGENGGVNLYGFVGNDSVNLIDPFGEQSTQKDIIIRVISGPDTMPVSPGADPLTAAGGEWVNFPGPNGTQTRRFLRYVRNRPVAGADGDYYNRLKDIAIKEYEEKEKKPCCAKDRLKVEFKYAPYVSDVSSALSGKGNAEMVLVAHGSGGGVTQLFFAAGTSRTSGRLLGDIYDLSSVVPSNYELGTLNVFSCHDANLPSKVGQVTIKSIGPGNTGTNGFLQIAPGFKNLIKQHCNCD